MDNIVHVYYIIHELTRAAVGGSRVLMHTVGGSRVEFWNHQA